MIYLQFGFSNSILFYGTKEYLVGKKIFFWGILFVFSYGCGTAILTNALLDQSEPEVYKARIISKQIENGKTITYRIDFEPWGPITENEIMRVSKTEFERLNVNDSIKLELQLGFLKTQWIRKNNLAQQPVCQTAQ